MKQEISPTLGYKYAIFSTDEQKQILNHQMFIYNQAYNICLNLQQKQWEANKDLDKKDRIYPKASQIDTKINQIIISKSEENYYTSFLVAFNKTVFLISKTNLELKKAIRINSNIEDIALISGNLIKTDLKNISKIKYDKKFLNLQRKQSRRVLKSKKLKTKLGANFKKTQNKLNTIFEKARSKKLDNCHKILSELSQKFDLMAFKNLKLRNRVFEYICGFTKHHDANVSINTLNLGLKSFGLGTSLVDLKHKAFRSDSIEFVS